MSGAGVTALHFVAGRVPPSHIHNPRGACLENSKEGRRRGKSESYLDNSDFYFDPEFDPG